MQDKEQETYELVSSWLDEYKSTDDSNKKNRAKTLIVAKMLPIIRRIAKKIARRSYDPIEDMIQAGAIGLLKAIDSYSKSVNNNFRMYAGCLIICETKHYLRDKLGTIRVPAYVQELIFRINDFTSSLTAEELDILTSDDVAEALNVPVSSVEFVKQIERRKNLLPLEDLFQGRFSSNDSNLSYDEYLSNGESREYEDTKLVLADAIKKLPDEYREVIELYYYESLYQKEIADRLNISIMSVSRKMKKAFNLMYNILADEEWNKTSNFPDD